MEPNGIVESNWFSILDGVFDPDGVTSKELDSCGEEAEPGSGEHVDGMLCNTV